MAADYVGPLWIALMNHIHEKLGQPRDAYETGSIPIAHSTIDEEAIRAILAKSEKSLKRQKQEGVKLIKGTLIVFDDMSHQPSMQRHQVGIMAELFSTSRHFACSIIASVHSVNSLGSLPRRQVSALILFASGNRREYESLSEQYSRLAGPDKSTFDAIYQLALGRDSPAFSFLVINVNRKPGRIFMLRFSDFIIPEE